MTGNLKRFLGFAVLQRAAELVAERGGPGSGHHGHKERPGQVGGSLPKSGKAGETQGQTGQCYYTAGKWMMDNAQRMSDARLTHGMASGQGPIEGIRFGHAWIEIGDAVVIDTERGLTLLKEQYYEVGQITDVVLYTYDEMIKEMLKHEHYGPWHEGAVRGGTTRSYPAPHKGRPGQIGGSLPRDAPDVTPKGKPEKKATKGQFPEGEDKTTEKIDRWFVEGIFPDDEAKQATVEKMGWARSGGEADSVVEKQVLAELAKRTGVDEADIRDITFLWKVHSANEDLRSLHLQRLAAEEFGVEVRPSILERIAAVETEREKLFGDREVRPGYDFSDKYYSFAEHGIPEADQRSVLRAMYDNTQEELRKVGFKQGDTVRLRRGAYVPRKIQMNWERGQEIELVGNPLSSWSVGAGKAKIFALDPPRYLKSVGAVFEMDAPVEAVISTARTGMGALREGEFVLLVDNLGHRAKVVSFHFLQGERANVSAEKGGDIPVLDIDWCEENEEWLRSKKSEDAEKPPLSTIETMQATVEWWREYMPPRYKGLLDATLKEKEADDG